MTTTDGVGVGQRVLVTACVGGKAEHAGWTGVVTRSPAPNAGLLDVRLDSGPARGRVCFASVVEPVQTGEV